MPKTKQELEQAYLHHQHAMMDTLREAHTVLGAVIASNEPLDTKIEEMRGIADMLATADYHAHRMIVHRRLIQTSSNN